MAAPKHVYEIFVKAPVPAVWTAITDPAFTRRYFFGTSVESTFEVGAPVRYTLPDGADAVEGVVEVVEPGRRLVTTWSVRYDAALAEEPPSRVEWTLTPHGESVTRLTLRHYDLGLSPATWANVRLGWNVVLGGLKTLLETGDELGDVRVEPDVEPADVTKDWHRAQAIDANNSAWELLDGRDLGVDEGEELLARVYAALYHWTRATAPGAVQRARAVYMCAKAHVVLGDGAVALRHAERCSALTASAGSAAADFDRACALEVTARALACLGRLDEAGVARAAALAVEIADPEDRAILEPDLAAGPWFGLA